MRRESRGARGRLTFMTACLALGVAAVTGVAAITQAVNASVQSDSRALLSGDVAVESRRAFPDSFDESLSELGARRIVRVVELPSMVRAEGSDRDPAIAELKAASEGYPLFGELVTDPPGRVPATLADDEVVASPELLAQLGAGVGDSIVIGGKPYAVVAELVEEPDRVDFAMTFGPRAFVSEAGVERSGLIGFGSRVKSKRLVALEPGASTTAASLFVDAVRARAKDAAYLRFKTFERPSPGVTRAIERIGSYLGLVALLSLLLGGIGVAQVVRAWLDSRVQAIATLRSLGFRPREVFVAYLGHVLVLALVGCAVGIAFGLATPFVVRAAAPELLEAGAGPLRWSAAARGLGLGLGTAAVFAMPPLTAVWRVSPARVLRSEAAPLAAPPAIRAACWIALAVSVFGFAWATSNDALVALGFSAGLAVLVALLSGAAAGVTRLARSLPRNRFGPTLRHGVAALARPGAGTIGAAVALGLGTLVVVALSLVGRKLSDEFANGTPDDAPSVFLVDVQPDQWDGVREIVLDEGAEDLDSTPVAMARLSAIDGTPVAELLRRRSEGRERWTLTREQRLTWSDELPAGNELVEGTLWSDPTKEEVSLETGFADSLGVEVGDTLTFDVQGVAKELTITSLREVDWGSFEINFFLLAEPAAMEGAPGWRLAAARVAPEREGALQSRVVEAFPNVGVIRMRPLMERITGTLGRIALAVRLLGGFTILVGIAILAGAVAASSLKRGAEAALLKTLGVTRRGVGALFAVEYGLLGLVAGIFGGLGAVALAWAFLHFGLEIEGVPSLVSVPVAGIGTAILATVAGLSTSARALAARPMQALRR